MRNGLIEYTNGNKYWYKEDVIHREDGPAIEYPNGDKCWYKEGLLHRNDGPAVEYADGDKRWFLYNELIKVSSQEEFDKLLKLKAFW